MAGNTRKEVWINEVMNSTQGMSRAEPPADLFEKIMSGVGGRATVKIIPMPVKQWAAAAILLLALNIGSVVYFTTRNKKTTGNPITAEIQPVSTYNY